MNKLTEIWYILTGTPYIKQWLYAKGTVVKVKPYKMSEKITNEFGEFKTPKVENMLWRKNCYYMYSDIHECTEARITHKGLKPTFQKYADRIYRVITNKPTEKPDLNKGADVDEFVIMGFTPYELQSYLETNTLIAGAFKAKNSLSELLTPQNMIIGLIAVVALYFGFKMITTGSL